MRRLWATAMEEGLNRQMTRAFEALVEVNIQEKLLLPLSVESQLLENEVLDTQATLVCRARRLLG